MTLTRLLAAASAGLVAVLVAGGLGTMVTRTAAEPLAPVVAVLVLGVVALVVRYGRRRARVGDTGYW